MAFKMFWLGQPSNALKGERTFITINSIIVVVVWGSTPKVSGSVAFEIEVHG